MTKKGLSAIVFCTMDGWKRPRSVVCLLILLALVSCRKADEERKPHIAEGKKAGEKVEPHLETLYSTQEAFISVAEKVTPSVVNISTVQQLSKRRIPFEIDPFFRDFFGDIFGDIPPQGRQGTSLGSGVIIDSQGDILTNYHVVRDAEEITVRLSDKTEFKGRVVGVDPRTDLAVIRIKADKDLPYAVLGDSDKIKVGQWAIAIGNPFGLDKTLTVGVISATGRSEVGVAAYESFIQTDASINPGNSGGPLLNIKGEVIGINSAIVASGQGIGFAIPINIARYVIDDLISKGKVTRGWIGVGIQSLTPELAESFGIKDIRGVLVNEIYKNSPAEKAGLKAGDVIVKFDGKDVDEPAKLQGLVISKDIGATVVLEVIRDRKSLSLNVKIEEMSVDEPLGQGREDWLGIVVSDLSQEMKEVLEIEGGVFVEDVKDGSFAESGGIRAGDVIISVNKRKMSDSAAYLEVVSKIKKGATISMLIRREGVTLYIAFKTGRE